MPEFWGEFIFFVLTGGSLLITVFLVFTLRTTMNTTPDAIVLKKIWTGLTCLFLLLSIVVFHVSHLIYVTDKEGSEIKSPLLTD